MPPVRNLIESLGYTANEQGQRAALRDWMADFRKDRLGSAVTKIEESKGGQWDPSADGITMHESMRRMRVLIERLNDARVRLQAGRPLHPDTDFTLKLRDIPPEGTAAVVDRAMKLPGRDSPVPPGYERQYIVGQGWHAIPAEQPR